MANFEYDLNDQDYQLVASQVDRQLFSGTNDYIRIIVRPTESMTQIVTLANNNQAIFYSSLNPTRFNINVSPFGAGLDELRLKEIGGNVNKGKGGDFKIYQNPDGNLYVKPNEIFNEFELPEGNYKIQIDFLNQLNAYDINDETDEGEEQEDNPTRFSTTYQFIIKEISTSRKEIRLKLLDQNILKDSDIITYISRTLNIC